MGKCGGYVGLDVHKETIAVAVARPRGGEVTSFGVIANRPAAVRKLLAKLGPDGQVLEVCYEAGPCGYGLYRMLTELGHRCCVVAPGLVPRKPGDRVKTDRRDALTLARLLRAGELTPVWVPGPEQEAMRDLTRAREDMKAAQLKARQRLSAFLLRHDRVYREGKSAWTQQHARWLEAQKFAHPAQQIVFQEYVDAVTAAGARVAGLDEQIRAAVDDWSLAPVVQALMALRGVHLLTAATVLAELGDLTRFDHPRQLMGFLGLVPGEYSSGARRRQGADHQDRQRPRPPRARRSRLELPLPGTPDRAPAAQGRARPGRGPGHRLEGAETPVRTLPGTRPDGKARVQGHHRHRPRTDRLPVGDRPHGRRSAPRDRMRPRLVTATITTRTGARVWQPERRVPVRRTLDDTTWRRASTRTTHTTRGRQLHDEERSGGTQPADIRVIHRRLKRSRSGSQTRDRPFNL